MYDVGTLGIGREGGEGGEGRRGGRRRASSRLIWVAAVVAGMGGGLGVVLRGHAWVWTCLCVVLVWLSWYMCGSGAIGSFTWV